MTSWCSDMEKREIYLDNSATTRICAEALRKYIEVSEGCFGNPSSLHSLGVRAEEEIKHAEGEILSSVKAPAGYGVIFTSSGSEANNLAIIGRAHAKERFKRGGTVVSFLGEHASVSEPCEALKREGFKVRYVGTREGKVDMDELCSVLDDSVVLVSCMMVNNETGAVYDLPSIARAIKARCRDGLFHVDATQSYMKIPFSVSVIGADLLTLSSHKIEGPKGVGALVVSDKALRGGALAPVVFGGGQQRGLRSGTENVPGIAAFGEAVRIDKGRIVERAGAMTAMREHILAGLASREALREISPTLPKNHAPHILNITLPGIKSETMLHFLSSRGIYVSSGSACSSHGAHASSALTAFGRTDRDADSSVRISLSHRNTMEETEALLDALEEGVKTLSRMK